MGNQCCCEYQMDEADCSQGIQARVYDHEYHLQNYQIQEDQERQNKYEDISLPKLHPNILKILFQQRPFQTEFNSILKPKKRRFGEDIYFGELGEGRFPNGLGKLYKSDGNYFIGYFVLGVAHGPGFYVTKESLYYSGKMENNAASDSRGKLVTPSLKYEGGFYNNEFHGKGKEESLNDHFIFEGKFENGKKIEGKLKWGNTNEEYQYVGAFNENQKFEGRGILKDPLGKFVGNFENGVKEGQDCEYETNQGIKYIGQYRQGIKCGRGKIINFDGTLCYEGQFFNGLPHGKGRAISRDGDVLESEWDYGISRLALSESSATNH